MVHFIYVEALQKSCQLAERCIFVFPLATYLPRYRSTLREVEIVVRRAKPASGPGPNGVIYRLYKMLLRITWWKKLVCRGVFISDTDTMHFAFLKRRRFVSSLWHRDCQTKGEEEAYYQPNAERTWPGFKLISQGFLNLANAKVLAKVFFIFIKDDAEMDWEENSYCNRGRWVVWVWLEIKWPPGGGWL